MPTFGRDKDWTPATDWRKGDKILKANKKTFEQRHPVSLCNTHAPKRSYSERPVFKTVENKPKKVSVIEDWHAHSMKTVPQTRKQGFTYDDGHPHRAPVEQPKKKALDVQHWKKYHPRQEKVQFHKGWVADDNGDYEHHAFSSVNKVVENDKKITKISYSLDAVDTSGKQARMRSRSTPAGGRGGWVADDFGDKEGRGYSSHVKVVENETKVKAIKKGWVSDDNGDLEGRGYSSHVKVVENEPKRRFAYDLAPVDTSHPRRRGRPF